jgi:Ni/Fe-hydrogenase subunit HybB-like protein
MAINKTIYREVDGKGVMFLGLFALLGMLAALGLAAAWRMEHAGHYVTGMTNQVVWGTPHVFAIFLILAASGALNVASIGSVFGRAIYKPLGRLSGLLAIGLLVGGLSVLVLDLGRPDRLIVAMTTYNFKSIFAWNIFLYVGFLAVVAVYLWLQMEWRMNRFAPMAGVVAFVWRLVLTTGTGAIFGFLIAREAYDAAVMAPLFIAMSFALGLAVYILVLIAVCWLDGRDLGDAVMLRMGRLLGIFAATVLYFTAVQHLTNLYAAEHAGVERFMLWSGGVYTILFWGGQVGLGALAPMLLVFRPKICQHAVALAALLVILGGMAHLYVIIIGGQAYPLNLFPGMVASSSFYDGVVALYSPSLLEIGLGVGGVAFAGLIVLVGLKVLRFLPDSLSDAAIDPHHRSRS